MKPKARKNVIQLLAYSIVFLLVFLAVGGELWAVELNSPRGGEYWRGNELYQIDWSTEKDTDRIELYYYDGRDWQFIDFGSSETHYSWVTPSHENNNARIKVERTDDTGDTFAAASDSFTIDSKIPAVEIDTPLSDTLFRGGDTVSISWTADSAGISGYKEFRLLYYDGNSWDTQITVDSDVREYIFGFPEDNTDSAKIRVDAVDYCGNVGKDSVEITVDSYKPEVEISYPAGGEYIVNDTVIYDTVSWAAEEPGFSGYDSFIIKRRILPDTAWEIRGVVSGDVRSFSDTFPSVSDSEAVELQLMIQVLDGAGNYNESISDTFVIGLPPEVNLEYVTESESGLPGDTTFSINNYREVDVEGKIEVEHSEILTSDYFKIKINDEEAEEFSPENGRFNHVISFAEQADTNAITPVTMNITLTDTNGYKIVEENIPYQVNLIRPDIELEWLKAEVDKNLVQLPEEGENYYRTNSSLLSIAGYVYYDDKNPGLFTLQADTQPLSEESGETWSFGLNEDLFVELEQGENQVVLSAENLYKNSRTKNISVIFDTEPSPIVEVKPEEEDRYTSDTSIELAVRSDEFAQKAKFINTSLAGETKTVFSKTDNYYVAEVNLADTSDKQKIKIEITDDLGQINREEIEVRYNPEKLFLESVKPDLVFREFRINEDIQLDTYPVRLTLYNNSSETVVFDREWQEIDLEYHYESWDGNIQESGVAEFSLDTNTAEIPPGYAGNAWFAIDGPQVFSDTGEIEFELSYKDYEYDPIKKNVIDFDELLIEPAIEYIDTDIYRGKNFNFSGSVINRSPRVSMQVDMFAVLFYRQHSLQGGEEITEYFEINELSDEIKRGVDSEGHDVALIPYEIKPAEDSPLGETQLYFGAVLNITGLPFSIDIVTDTTIYIQEFSEEPVLEKVYHYYSHQGGAPGPANPSSAHPVSFHFEIAESTSVNITLYTLSGEKVWETKENMEAGSGEITWDGKNESGIDVASGGYLYHIDAGGAEQTGKIAIFRGTR